MWVVAGDREYGESGDDRVGRSGGRIEEDGREGWVWGEWVCGSADCGSGVETLWVGIMGRGRAMWKTESRGEC